MRINVYHEEITKEFEFVEKCVEETGKTYYGFRIYMKSAPELHHASNDDDRTAITFWFGEKSTAMHFWNNASEFARRHI
jgi:hypothetical protein